MAGGAEVGADPEAVLDRAEDAVRVGRVGVLARLHEWADERACRVSAGAEAVLRGESPHALVLVVEHDDDAVLAERRRRLDERNLLREEVVELRVAVVHRLAVRLAIVAPVRDDEVEIGDVTAREVGVERRHPVVRRPGRNVVREALAVRDVGEVDRRVTRRVEAGQRAWVVACAGAARPGVALRGPGLEPHVPAHPRTVELVEQVVDVVTARVAAVLLLASGELPTHERDIVRLRPVRRRVVTVEPRRRPPDRRHQVGRIRRREVLVVGVLAHDHEDVAQAWDALSAAAGRGSLRERSEPDDGDRRCEEEPHPHRTRRSCH